MEEPAPERENGKWLSPPVTGLLISGIGIGLILVSVIWGDDFPSLEDFGLIGAGAVILGLVFPYVRSLKLPGGIEAEIRELQRGVRVNAERISLLSLLAMSREVYLHLKNLLEGGEATKDYWVNPWVRVELEHLRNVGYIAMRKKDQGIRDIPGDTAVDLAHYVYITPLGKAYVELRKEVDIHLQQETAFGASTPGRPGAADT